MSESNKKELLKYFNGMLLFLANHGWTDKDDRAVAIWEMIRKSEVTEEWIEEKVERFMLQCPGIILKCYKSVRIFAKDFIRKLAEEIHERK